MDIKYSKERIEIEDMLQTIDAVYAGNFIIKKDIKKYLHQATGEENDAFDRRGKLAVFYNFLKPIIRLAAERPFANKVTYSEDFPKDFDDLKSNFDGLGNGLLFFAFDAFSKAIKHATIGIAPDYDNETKKPYARLIDVKDIIGIWKKVNADGSYYFERVQFVVRSNAVQDVVGSTGILEGFKEVKRTKIIELIHPNLMRTYNVTEEKTTDKGMQFNAELEITMDKPNGIETLENFEKIPFHLFTTEQPIEAEDTIKIVPTFYDLSLLNLSHYNKQSDQDNIMTVSRYAILTVTGVSQNDFDKQFKIKRKKVIGPFTILVFEDEKAKAEFVEHSGKAITAGQNDIIKTEKAMVSLLKDYLQRNVVMETATEKNIAEKHQNLYTIYLANKLEQVLTKVFMDFATYMGIDIKNTENLISFSRDYSATETAKKIEAIIKSREMGDLSAETFLSELSTLGVYSGDFDPKAEAEKALEEAGRNTQPPAGENESNAFNEEPEENED